MIVHTAALESVLPPEELGSFMALDRREKLLQLQDLSDIVCGIRLHNMGSGKGGAGIENRGSQEFKLAGEWLFFLLHARLRWCSRVG